MVLNAYAMFFSLELPSVLVQADPECRVIQNVEVGAEYNRKSNNLAYILHYCSSCGLHWFFAFWALLPWQVSQMVNRFL